MDVSEDFKMQPCTSLHVKGVEWIVEKNGMLSLLEFDQWSPVVGDGHGSRKLTTCFQPDSTIFIYEDADLEDMVFEQTFSHFRSNGTSANMNKTRNLCPINDIHHSFNTLAMQRSCALVGNSGILLKSLCGQEIDSHDLVMRANMAKIKGYSPDVGTKTSVMTLNAEVTEQLHEILIKNHDENNTNYTETIAKFKLLNDTIVWYAKLLEEGNIYSRMLRGIAGLLRRENLNTKFGFSYMSAGVLTQRKYKTKKYPSSGLIMLMAARTFCKNITLYGFYPYQKSPSGEPLLHHYYEPELLNFTTHVHNFDQEYKQLQELNKLEVIRLVVDPCKR